MSEVPNSSGCSKGFHGYAVTIVKIELAFRGNRVKFELR